MLQPREAIRDIAHLGHVELKTPKPDASLKYFTELLGMVEVARERQSVYLRGYGDHARTTLKLTEAAQPGIGHIAFRAWSPRALNSRVSAVQTEGYGMGWSDGDIGHGPSFRFCDPDGHMMEVYYEEEKYVPPAELRSTLKNLPMKYPGRGIGVRRTDHLALLAKDVGKNRSFMQRLLGLMLREQVVYDNGKREIGSWLSATPNHHELAYVVDSVGASGRLHHVAFWTDNRDDVLRAADIFRENDVFIETGPAKHNNSQAFYIYSYEPGGNRIEIYTGSFLVFAPDFEPVVWDETARGTGVYWGGALPESFLSYATPPAVPAAAPAAKVSMPVIDPR